MVKWNETWLSEKDDNGIILSDWVTKDGNLGHVKCMLCSKEIKFSTTGLQSMMRHSQNAKHKELSKIKFSTKERHLVSTPKAAQKSLIDPPLESKVCAAEAKYLFKLAENDFSFRSCDQTPELFQSMFSDSVIAGKFSMSRTKASYCVSDGIGPTLFDNLCQKLKSSEGCFTLLYDETTTLQRIKQMDVLARFWCESEGVKTLYLTSFFFARATAEKLAELFVENVFKEASLPWNKLFNTSSDGPRINEKLHSLMNARLQETGHHGLLPFLPCSLHIVHNAFQKMLNTFSIDIPQLAFDLHAWFKHLET